MKNIPALSFESIEMFEWPFMMVNPHPWKWVDAQFDHFQLWIVLEGTGQVWVDGVEYPLKPGACFTYSPESELWAQSPGGVFHHFACYFFPVIRGQICTQAAELPFLNVMIEESAFLRDLCFQAVRCAEEGHDAARQQAARYIWILLSMMWKAENTDPLTAIEQQILQQAQNIKREPEKAYPVDALATAVSLSPSQYTRIFNRMLHTSPNQYHIRAKVDKARTLLRETSMEIGRIADLLNYSDAFFFSRQFKQFTQRSPMQYRKYPYSSLGK